MKIIGSHLNHYTFPLRFFFFPHNFIIQNCAYLPRSLKKRARDKTLALMRKKKKIKLVMERVIFALSELFLFVLVLESWDTVGKMDLLGLETSLCYLSPSKAATSETHGDVRLPKTATWQCRQSAADPEALIKKAFLPIPPKGWWNDLCDLHTRK